jgi:hypothetical protein
MNPILDIILEPKPLCEVPPILEEMLSITFSDEASPPLEPTAAA